MEKRRNQRVYFKMQLTISQINKQENENIDLDRPITVVDISKSGAAFLMESELPIGYYFNSKISVGDSGASLSCMVKIVRKTKKDDTNLYGCEFIGLETLFEEVFRNYQDYDR